MQKFKNFLLSINKKALTMVFAIVAFASCLTFGGLQLLQSGDKNATINTPEISTEVGGEVDALNVSQHDFISFGDSLTSSVKGPDIYLMCSDSQLGYLRAYGSNGKSYGGSDNCLRLAFYDMDTANAIEKITYKIIDNTLNFYGYWSTGSLFVSIVPEAKDGYEFKGWVCQTLKSDGTIFSSAGGVTGNQHFWVALFVPQNIATYNVIAGTGGTVNVNSFNYGTNDMINNKINDVIVQDNNKLTYKQYDLDYVYSEESGSFAGTVTVDQYNHYMALAQDKILTGNYENNAKKLVTNLKAPFSVSNVISDQMLGPDLLSYYWNTATYANAISGIGYAASYISIQAGLFCWPFNTYTVAYYKPTNADRTITPVTATANTGYTFSGWSTGVDSASGKTYYLANFVADEFQVRYNTNTATSGSNTTQTATYNSTLTASTLPSGWAKTGYTFKGWATSADGEVVYSAGKTIPVNDINNIYNTVGKNGTYDLYAVWEINTYTLTVNYYTFTGNAAPQLNVGTSTLNLNESTVISETYNSKLLSFRILLSSDDYVIAQGGNPTVSSGQSLYVRWAPTANKIVNVYVTELVTVTPSYTNCSGTISESTMLYGSSYSNQDDVTANAGYYFTRDCLSVTSGATLNTNGVYYTNTTVEGKGSSYPILTNVTNDVALRYTATINKTNIVALLNSSPWGNNSIEVKLKNDDTSTEYEYEETLGNNGEIFAFYGLPVGAYSVYAYNSDLKETFVDTTVNIYIQNVQETSIDYYTVTFMDRIANATGNYLPNSENPTYHYGYYLRGQTVNGSDVGTESYTNIAIERKYNSCSNATVVQPVTVYRYYDPVVTFSFSVDNKLDGQTTQPSITFNETEYTCTNGTSATYNVLFSGAHNTDLTVAQPVFIEGTGATIDFNYATYTVNSELRKISPDNEGNLIYTYSNYDVTISFNFAGQSIAIVTSSAGTYGHTDVKIALRNAQNQAGNVTLNLLSEGYSGDLSNFVIDNNLTITGAQTISNTSNNDSFIIQAGKTVTLDGDMVYQNDKDSSIKFVVYGTLILNSGTIKGASEGNGGTGVLVKDGGTFIMNGGSIEGNQTYAVKIEQGGTFTMNGGTIYNTKDVAIYTQSPNVTFLADNILNTGEYTILADGVTITEASGVSVVSANRNSRARSLNARTPNVNYWNTQLKKIKLTNGAKLLLTSLDVLTKNIQITLDEYTSTPVAEFVGVEANQNAVQSTLASNGARLVVLNNKVYSIVGEDIPDSVIQDAQGTISSDDNISTNDFGTWETVLSVVGIIMIAVALTFVVLRPKKQQKATPINQKAIDMFNKNK